MHFPRPPHSWSVSPRRAIILQTALAERVIRGGRVANLRLAAGVDLAFGDSGETAVAGVVVWDVIEHAVVEQHVVHRAVRFPYVPGLLTFREAPAILACLKKLRSSPDVFLFDGQGYAHPRRCGLASHLGLLIDRPSIGCAKSLLIGDCGTVGVRRGATAPIEHHGECIGYALRTRDGVNPMYISVGHRLSLEASVEIVLACGGGYRVPEPTRRADQLVAASKT